MGTSRTPEELARKFARAGVAMAADLPSVQVSESSLIVKNAVLGLAPARLRGVGKKGAKLGVRYNEGRFAGEAKSLVYATGPWQLIERDTKDHDIPKARGARARARFAVIPGGAEGGVHGKGGVRARVHVKGTKGKHPWERGVTAAIPAINRVFESSTNLMLRRMGF